MESQKPSAMADVPTYRIGAVARLTGISLHLLRMWERRYDIVTPSRSEGGDRLYTQHDVERLILIRQLHEAGHAIGRIARLSSSELREMLPKRAVAAASATPPSDLPGEVGARFIEAISVLDIATAERVLARAAMVLGPRDVALRVLVPALHTVGERWEDGSLSIAHEHAAAAVLRSHLGALMRAHASDPEAPGLLATTPAGELHEFGALVAGLVASALGWRVIYLGPNLPAAEIVQAARVGQVRAVVLSALVPRPGLVDELELVRAGLPADVAVLVGGGGVANLTVPRGVRVLGSLDELEQALGPGA